MKKVFLFLMACCLSLTMSAKVAYLLPNGCAYNSASGELTGFPNEPRWNSIESKDIDQAPERAAAYWFKDNYVSTDKGVFVTPEQFIANNADIQVLWMYLDRDISRDDVYTIFGGNDFKDALTAFVKRGGNVFMCKQANRLLQDIGRTTMGIDHGNTGYTNGHDDTWYAAVDFDNRQHRGQDHPIFKDMVKWEHDGDKTDIEFQKTKAGYDKCTDNNCGINRDHMGLGGDGDHQCKVDYINTFDSNNTARVLGGWGGTGCCDYGGIIEFKPTGDFKGTVLMMGLAAYQWAELNEKIDNVRLFTSNVLTYLNGPSRSDVHIDEDFRADGREGADGDAHNRFMILHPNVRGLDAVAYDVIENAGITEKINDGANRLAFTSAGHVKLQIKLNETRGDQNWARGIYTFTRDIDFAFNTSAQAIADADLSSNGLDGETGKFMILHRNMRGLAAPIENYEISYDGIEEANRAVVEKFWDGDYDRLKFTKAGIVKLNITMTSDVHNTEYGKGEHHAVKTVTFAQPAFTWTHEPDHAAITEDKPAAHATCDVPGTTVKYESDNTEIASIDAETGKITYIKAGTCNIYAYIEINGVKYRSNAFALTVNAPTFQWHTWPETMKNGQKADIEFVVLYISAEEEYELSGANAEIVDGKICALAEGTIIVTPKTVVNGETYYGEAKNITVTAAELTWHVNPENLEVSDPHDGTLMETKPSIWALLNGESDPRVHYRSENTEYIEINSDNFLIYKKPTEGEGVLIEAYVQIGGVEYTLSRKTKAVAPVAEWVTAPATEAYVGDVVAIAAKANYGAAPAGFETENCTYNTETGELTFTTEGTATVKPYVTAYGVRYYGAEQISINVTVKPTTTTYTRPVTPNKYGTICLERTSIALEGAIFYWPAYKDQPEGLVSFVTLEKVDVLNAGQGYFFFATSSEVKVTMSLDEEAQLSPIDDGAATHGMHGNFGPEDMPVPNYTSGLPNEYILSNNTLVYGVGNYIGEHRAYLKMSEVPAGSSASEVPGRHYVRMVVDQSNTTTDILSVGAEHEATKIVRDGKLYILRAGSLYTVEGQLVK